MLGFGALLALVACLAVTPLMTLARARIASLRFWWGMWVFVLGVAGLAVHVVYGPGGLGRRVAGSAVDWTGLLIVVALIPLAATSGTAAKRLLGAEWKRWQRALVWAVWLLAAAHLAVMGDGISLAGLWAATLPAVVLRLRPVRVSVRAWRAGGYEDGAWWAVLGFLGSLTVAGVAVLAAGEVIAVAHAFAAAAGA